MFVLSGVELYCQLLKFYILWLHTGRVVSLLKFQLQAQKAYRELFQLKDRICHLFHRRLLPASCPQGRGRFPHRSDGSRVVFPSRTKPLIYADHLLILSQEHRPINTSLIVLQQFLTVLCDARRNFSHLDWKRYHIKWLSLLQGKVPQDIYAQLQQQIYPTALQNHGFPYDCLYPAQINLVTRTVCQSPCSGSFCVLIAFTEQSNLKQIHALQAICMRMNWLVVSILPLLEQCDTTS